MLTDINLLSATFEFLNFDNWAVEILLEAPPAISDSSSDSRWLSTTVSKCKGDRGALYWIVAKD